MAIKDHLRTLKISAWLGWQIESNWARPSLFLLYSFIRPIAATLILVIMYLIVKQNVASEPALFSYMYLGATFYMFVSSVVFGITYVIHTDREHYQTLRNIYISPISLYVYLIGRAAGKVALATLAVIISLIFGIVVLGLPFNLLMVDWILFVPTMALGMACLISLGLALAGISLLTAKHSTSINEGVGGLVYLLCGAVFPITVLPAWGQAIGLTIPITYWLELIRRSLYPGEGIELLGGLQDFTDGTIMIFLLISTLIFTMLSLTMFHYADRIARKKGKLDMITTY
ncbi:MAG: ABC transporter permease [Euryarchaeota archaeon]|nr:ABC transporter permease [Euryarchaeota archaeon]